MTFIDLLILGSVIGSNNLAVALSLGAMGQAARRFRVMLVFGIFEFVMPLLGIGLGAATARVVGLHTNVIGAVLLIALGLLTVLSGIRNRRQDEKLAKQITQWSGLVFLALGLSIDNVVVGFSLGLDRAEPLAVATTIACFSVLFTWIGMRLGHESRRGWEQISKIGAGILLVGFGAANGMGWI
ncbi:manganese efflux pump [Sulfurovum sp. TSL1]|uniref:manganese efflux pump MntP n=1 Tax=Sulfurovum sp. TSL1 TaxID=2826994 RepID=UPI001CC475D2|nr:manganese efflux pump [Sulfurovum sp. TSL1]GIT97733.1 putative manganese efflux pump MntP [Sulfurovum sp. TSL1]